MAYNPGSWGSIELESRTYYISTAGSDSTGNGTQSNPWYSPHKILSEIDRSIDPNSEIIIDAAAGSYNFSNILHIKDLKKGRLVIRGKESGTIGTPDVNFYFDATAWTSSPSEEDPFAAICVCNSNIDIESVYIDVSNIPASGVYSCLGVSNNSIVKYKGIKTQISESECITVKHGSKLIGMNNDTSNYLYCTALNTSLVPVIRVSSMSYFETINSGKIQTSGGFNALKIEKTSVANICDTKLFMDSYSDHGVLSADYSAVVIDVSGLTWGGASGELVSILNSASGRSAIRTNRSYAKIIGVSASSVSDTTYAVHLDGGICAAYESFITAVNIYVHGDGSWASNATSQGGSSVYIYTSNIDGTGASYSSLSDVSSLVYMYGCFIKPGSSLGVMCRSMSSSYLVSVTWDGGSVDVSPALNTIGNDNSYIKG